MQHGFHLPKLGRNKGQRRNMIRQLVTHLFEHESIQTTYTRAMLLRRYAERAISMAKRGSDQGTLKVSELINKPAIAYKVFTDLVERYRDRQGGYTRVWKIGQSQDQYRTPRAIIELVDNKDDLRKQFAELSEKMKKQGSGSNQSK